MSANDESQLQSVTPENFAEVEMDARIFRFTEAGGLNRGLVYDTPTPTDNQPVPRMNRDTLYAGIPIDTSEGYSITIPEHPEDRYVSAYILDNEHHVLHILRGSGETFALGPEVTRWVVAIIRVQLLDANDEADVAATAAMLETFKVESGSSEEKPIVNWDWQGMLDLRHQYEAQYTNETQVPADWQGYRGEVDRYGGHNIAVAATWGLFPDTEAVYISQFPELPADGCFKATYAVPDNDAFWSITVYDAEGYLFSDHNSINSGSAVFNDDGTVTMHFGDCDDAANGLDITLGWNLLMRVYRPGASVRAGVYAMPEITRA